MSDKPTLVILAAGLGSRYGSLKQIDSIGPHGERIIDYSVYDAIRAGFKKIVYVIRKSFENEFNEIIRNSIPSTINTSLAFQENDIPDSLNVEREKPWGTGHAVISADSEIDGPFAVINADDFYGAESYRQAYNFMNQNRDSTKSGLIGYQLENTLSEFGFVSRGICEVDDRNYITSIVERTRIRKTNNLIIFKNENDIDQPLNGNETVSMNMFIFEKSVIPLLKKHFHLFIQENRNDPKAEFYIPSTVNSLIKNNETSVKVIGTDSEWFGLTYSKDKQIAKERIEHFINQGIYPQKLWSEFEID